MKSQLQSILQNLSLDDLSFALKELDKGSPFLNSRSISKLIDRHFSKVGEDRTQAKPGYFCSIRYPVEPFLQLMNYLRKLRYYYHLPEKLTFLDVGSCNGEKVFIASHYFDKATGVEISELSYQLAQRALKGIENIELFNCDAFDNPEPIRAADIIYMYSPIDNSELMLKLAEHIIENMKIGALLIEVRPTWLTTWLKKRFNFQGKAGGFPIIEKLSERRFKISLIHSFGNDLQEKSQLVLESV